MTGDEIESIEDHRVDEFDPGTRILAMNDGSVRLKVHDMPPSWKCVRGAFDSFESTLSDALGIRVDGLDKELFSIASPAPDTIVKLREYLIAFRLEHECK